MMIRISLVMVCMSWMVVLAGCSPGSNTCKQDLDCSPGFMCISGVCYQKDDGGPDGWDGNGDPGDEVADDRIDGGDEGQPDDGDGEPGDGDGEPGDGDGDEPDDGDAGGDQGETWDIVPGASIGPLNVSQGMYSPHTLGEIRGTLGEQGAPVEGNPWALAFRGETLWVSGIDTNSTEAFDAGDHVLSIMVGDGFDAATAEGLRPGSTQAQVRAAYANPDFYADLPPTGEFPGGKIDEYFSLGVYFGYDEAGVVKTVSISRSYLPPDGTISPSTGSLSIGGSTIQAGDGYQTGTKQNVHRGALGVPDWSQNIEQEIDTCGTVDFYLDSYRIQGMEFVGGDGTCLWYDVDRLLAIMLYPLFYGTTAAGNGVGSTKASWETELGAPVSVNQNPDTGATSYIYAAGSRQFAIMYTNDGASADDKATVLVLNYQEQ